MGNFTPYSEEWEKQHIQRQMDAIREKQKNDPWPLRLLVKAHSVGHCIVLSFFEIKKTSLQMPFTLVIGKFAVQKNATSL